jgi:hypothetical protein
MAETLFWQGADERRVGIYREAWQRFGARINGMNAGSLIEEHEQLVNVANELLPADPLSEALGSSPEERLRTEMVEDVSNTYGFANSYYPRLELI